MDSALAQNLPLMFGLIGIVVVLSALLSGFIERSSFPQLAVFLLIGLALGPRGLGALDVGLDSPTLRAVATLSLALVLFTDALTLDIQEVKAHAKLAAIILGPGTVLAAGMVAFLGNRLLGLAPAAATMMGAALVSTDPVLMRGLLRRRDLPGATRQALRLESGLNDIVLLPIILVAMAFAASGNAAMGEAPMLLLKMLLVAPAIGIAIAWAAIFALVRMRRKIGVRRDYESLYSLGTALAAFAGAEIVHSSGYIAAFAAGLTIAALDVELCDCFREYGETTAEMLLLFTFVLMGASLMWTGLDLLDWASAIFIVLALAARPLSLLLSLAPLHVDPAAKRLIIWFGPRGLSTLLLILVAVFADAPGAERAFQYCTLVVLASIVFHGGSIMAFARSEQAELVEEESDPVVVSAQEVRRLIDDQEEVWLGDARSVSSYHASRERLRGAVRIDPDRARPDAEARGIPKEAWAALFCT